MIVNISGCPDGWATDHVLLMNNDPLSCDVPIAAFIVVSLIVTILRVFASTQHTVLWIKRSRKESKAAAKGNKGRLPIVPTLSWFLTLCYSLMFLLSGLNIANSRNGGAPLLFGIGWTLFAIISLFYLARFVSLGYRIAVPTSRLGLLSGAEKLARFDTKGKISLGLSAVAIVVQFCFLCIVPFFFKTDERYIRAAIGVQAYFVVQHAISITHHIERVKSMIRTSRDANAANTSDSIRKELDRVTRNLTNQELSLDVISLISLTFHLLVTSGVLPLHWIVAFAFFIFEAVTSALIALSDSCGRKRREKDGTDFGTQANSAESRGKQRIKNVSPNVENQVAATSTPSSS